MAFDTSEIEAQIQLIDWRNTQLAQITDQLEGAFPDLQNAIDDYVAALALWKVAGTHGTPRKAVVDLVEPWAKTQSTETADQAKAQLDEILISVPSNSEAARLAASFLPALAGVGLIASSVAALPARHLCDGQFNFILPRHDLCGQCSWLLATNALAASRAARASARVISG